MRALLIHVVTIAAFLVSKFGSQLHADEKSQPTPTATSRVSVMPLEDPQAVLHNPDMGWVLYENYPVDPSPTGSSTMLTLPDEEFPGVDEVAVMFAWSDVETTEGVYDFTAVDKAYDYWKMRNKNIQLRMSTVSLLWWNNANPPRGQGAPDYVLQKLPETKKQTRICEGVPYVEVDGRDPFYLSRLEAFLHAVADHFDDQRPVTLVDLRGFGLWGEWHTGFQFESIEARRAALKGIIDRYSDAFPHHWLSLSYSYDPDSPKSYYAGPTNTFDPKFTEHYQQFLEYSAFDYALTKPNVTFRRDGAGGAVHSNERKLCEAAYSQGKGPMMAEFLGGYEANRKGGLKHVTFMVTDALSLHPNYVCLLGWQGADALAFLKQQPELIGLGLRTMGYRLVPVRIEFAPEATSGEGMELKLEWVNRGVGRALRDFELRLHLIDADNERTQFSAGVLPTSQWLQDKPHSLEKSVNLPQLKSGKYELRASLHDGTNRTVQLPVRELDQLGSFHIGQVIVR